MPNGCIHTTIDFIAFGRSYFELHQKKDKAYETLGSKHRVVNPTNGTKSLESLGHFLKLFLLG